MSRRNRHNKAEPQTLRVREHHAYATPQEVASTLKYSEKQVRRWCVAGQVRAERIGPLGAWRISVDETGRPLEP